MFNKLLQISDFIEFYLDIRHVEYGSKTDYIHNGSMATGKLNHSFHQSTCTVEDPMDIDTHGSPPRLICSL